MFPYDSRCYPFRSKQTLPRQFNLARGFPLLEPAFRNTATLSFCELEFVVGGVPCAGAVVGEVDAGEGVGAEVVVTGGCSDLTLASLSISIQFSHYDS